MPGTKLPHYTPTQTTKGSTDHTKHPPTHTHTHTHTHTLHPCMPPLGSTRLRRGPQVGFGLRREEVGGVLGEEVKGGVKVSAWEGGATAPPKGRAPPKRGQKGGRGDSLPTPSPGRGGIEVPLVSLRYPNNFDFFRPRRRKKQQRRRARTLFAVSQPSKKLQNAWLLWVLRFSVSWVHRVFFAICAPRAPRQKIEMKKNKGGGIAKEKKRKRNEPEKKKTNFIVMGSAFCGGWRRFCASGGRPKEKR